MIVPTPIGPMGFEQHGAGTDLLLLHSLLTDRRVYDRIVPALAIERRVTLIDLPGYGDSVSVAPQMSSYATAVAGLAEVLGLSRDMAIIGNGLGAFVALALAGHSPDRLGSLVLAGVAARFPDQAKGAFDQMATLAATSGMGAIAEVALGRIFTADYLAENPQMVEERRQAFLRMNPEGFSTGCRAIRDVDLTTTLAGIRIPTLVVVGGDDQATPPSYGRIVADSIPAAQYVEIPGLAHAPQLQSPDRFIAAMQPFLSLS